MKKGKNLQHIDSDTALQALAVEWGEPILYRATGRFLGSLGLGPVPRDTWGLIVLTPTRVGFRHFAQAHPLLGGSGDEVRWEVGRHRFDQCEAVQRPFWSRFFSGTPDHIVLTGPGTRLALEAADDQSLLPQAWNAAPPLT
jgi:hypothetical protein